MRPEEDPSRYQEQPVAVTGTDGLDGTDVAAALAASVGSPERFALVFDRHAAAIRAYCARRVGGSLADDLVAEVFLTAFAQRTRFDSTRAVAPWLYGIATNVLHRARRQEVRAYRALAATGHDPVVEGVAERAAERADAARLSRPLAAALAAMPARERDVLLLFAWANLGYAEIAEALAIPTGTVRSRLSRARTRLRAALPAPVVDKETR